MMPKVPVQCPQSQQAPGGLGAEQRGSFTSRQHPTWDLSLGAGPVLGPAVPWVRQSCLTLGSLAPALSLASHSRSSGAGWFCGLQPAPAGVHLQSLGAGRREQDRALEAADSLTRLILWASVFLLL